jgi:hypothetical protein
VLIIEIFQATTCCFLCYFLQFAPDFWEKCVHCGACLWNCSQANPENPERMNIAFRAGTGGLHSAEN